MFILRIAIKGLVELCHDENQFVLCLDGIKRYENIVRSAAQNISLSPVDAGAADEKKYEMVHGKWYRFTGMVYHIQLESVQLMIMVLSSPLYGRPSKILDKMLQPTGHLTDLAPKLSQNFVKTSSTVLNARLTSMSPEMTRLGEVWW